MTGTVLTNDGVALRYTAAGAGRPLVLVHGLWQSSEQFRHQLDELSSLCRVIGYDHRGHGESDKATHGYTVHRLAADLQQVLTTLDLSDVVLAGHSLGCQVMWAYLELFGTDRLSKLVFADCSNFFTSNPACSEQTRADAGAQFTPDEVTALTNAVADSGTYESVVRGTVERMLTAGAAPDLEGWIVGHNLRVSPEQAAALSTIRPTSTSASRSNASTCPPSSSAGGPAWCRGRRCAGLPSRSPGRGWRSSTRTRAAATSCSWRTRPSSTRWSPTSP